MTQLLFSFEVMLSVQNSSVFPKKSSLRVIVIDLILLNVLLLELYKFGGLGLLSDRAAQKARPRSAMGRGSL